LKVLKVLFYSKEFVTMHDRLADWTKGHEADTADEDALAEKIVDADVLVTRPGVVVSGDLLDSAPRLRLRQQWGTGLDGVDLDMYRKRGIAVCNTPSRGTGNAEGVAEIALLHLLLLGRKYAFAQQNIQSGKMFSPSGVSLWRKTVCVVGLGNLGRTLAERLTAMGMRLRGVNRSLVDPARLNEMKIKEFFLLSRLRKAVPGCRFVVAALALNDETRGIFDDEFFQSMDEGAFFVNVARGGLVKEDALLRALNERHIAGAGLDVLENEPPLPGNPLLTHPSVTLTPHIGGVTDESFKGVFDFIQDNVDRLSRGKPLLSRQDLTE
jgi:phosphoglycerate dehydrogenase-like enzyme